MSLDKNIMYKMDHKNRGVVALIDNREFKEFGYVPRIGQDKDVENYQNAFEHLGFKIELHQNKTKVELLEIMSQYGHKNFTHHDCFIAVFLSYAAKIDDEPFIFAIDDFVALSDLTQPILKSISLNGKPKIFFIDHLRTKLKEKYYCKKYYHRFYKYQYKNLSLRAFDLDSWSISGSDYLFGYQTLVDCKNMGFSIEGHFLNSEFGDKNVKLILDSDRFGYSDALNKSIFSQFDKSIDLIKFIKEANRILYNQSVDIYFEREIKTNLTKSCFFERETRKKDSESLVIKVKQESKKKKKVFFSISDLPERLSNFVCRKDELVKISDLFNTIRMIVINGCVGNGKSAVANEFVYDFLDKTNHNKCVRWFRSQTADLLEEDYTLFAQGILNEPDLAIIDDHKIDAVNNTIIARKKELLLVFDNVVEFDQIEKYIQSLLSINHVKIIITSRNNMLSESFHTIVLESFNIEKSLQICMDSKETLFGGLKLEEKETLICFKLLNSHSINQNLLNGYEQQIINLRKLGLITKIIDKNVISTEKFVLDAFKSYTYNDPISNATNEVIVKKLKDSIDCFKKAQDDMGLTSFEIAQSLNSLGLVFSKLDNQDEANKYLLDAYEMRKSLLDKADLILAKYSHDLAICNQKKGDLNLAKMYHLVAYEIKKRILDEENDKDDLELAKYLYHLAICYQKQGDLNKAKEHHLIAYEIRKKLSEISYETVESLNSLGLVFSELGNDDEALKYHLDANIAKRWYFKSEEELIFVKYLESLAIVYQKLGKIFEAKNSLLEAYKYRATFSNENENEIDARIAELSYDIGLLHEKKGDLDQAEQFLFEAYEKRKSLVKKYTGDSELAEDTGDSELAKYSFHLARIYQENGKIWDLQHYLIAYNMKKNSSDEEDLILAEYSHHLGKSFSDLGEGLGRIDKAKKYHLIAYNLRKSLLDKDKDDLILAEYAEHLGKCYLYFEEINEAKVTLLEAYKMKKRLLLEAKHDSIIAEYSFDLGISSRESGNLDKAKQYLLEACEMFKILLNRGEDDTIRSKCFYRLGIAYKHLEDMVQSSKYLLEAYYMRKNLLVKDKDDLTLAEYSYHLAISFENLGKNGKAREYHLIAYKMRKRLHENKDHQETLESLKKVKSLLRRPGTFLQAFNYSWKAFRMRSHLNSLSKYNKLMNIS